MTTSVKKILAICGSNRVNSANLQLIQTIIQLTKNTLTIKLYEGLTDLPYFNQDTPEEAVERSVIHFRREIQEADGILICTPEYVFSLPGILKNALEWTVSTMVFADKPTALITASSLGDKAHQSLELIMKTLGAKTEKECSLLISGIRSKMDASGVITDEDLQNDLNILVESFYKSMD